MNPQGSSWAPGYSSWNVVECWIVDWGERGSCHFWKCHGVEMMLWLPPYMLAGQGWHWRSGDGLTNEQIVAGRGKGELTCSCLQRIASKREGEWAWENSYYPYLRFHICASNFQHRPPWTIDSGWVNWLYSFQPFAATLHLQRNRTICRGPWGGYLYTLKKYLHAPKVRKSQKTRFIRFYWVWASRLTIL